MSLARHLAIAIALGAIAWGGVVQAGECVSRGEGSATATATPGPYAFVHVDPAVVRSRNAGNAESASSAGAVWRETPCFRRLTEPLDAVAVLEVLEQIASLDRTISILRTLDGDALRFDRRGGIRLFRIPELRLADGRLMHRGRGRDTELGAVYVATDR